MKTNNKRAAKPVFDPSVRLAGGAGMSAASQGAEALLRRAVLANLLWENVAYEGGEDIAQQIATLVPQVDPDRVAWLAIEARTEQKLRHVPLLIASEMSKHATHKHLVGMLLPQIILRADEIAEFLAIYWRDGKHPISKQVKKGLAAAFDRFNEYGFGKYASKGKQVRARDVMFLTHPKPKPGKEALYALVANDVVPTPDTWEVALSAGADKKATWERLITENQLGALAFVRNLRNMEQVGVDRDVIAYGFANLKPEWLLPFNFITAARHAPRWQRELEECMLRGLAGGTKLPGHSIFVVDVSGSMHNTVSAKSELTRADAAKAMAMLAAEVCESVTIYATAGSDMQGVHATELARPYHGFALVEELTRLEGKLGGGGIFTRQCLEYIKNEERGVVPDRIMVFSDSQDCDHVNNRVPRPFGKQNYIVDVSANTRGINFKGAWTAEISGWSEHFLKYIAASEGVQLPDTD